MIWAFFTSSKITFRFLSSVNPKHFPLRLERVWQRNYQLLCYRILINSGETLKWWNKVIFDLISYQKAFWYRYLTFRKMNFIEELKGTLCTALHVEILFDMMRITDLHKFLHCLRWRDERNRLKQEEWLPRIWIIKLYE